MKKCKLLLVLPILCLLHFSAIAQKDQIKAVENNLMGSIQFEGDAPMNLANRMAYYKIKGLSIAVIKNYQILWTKGYGWADEDKKIPVTAQTLFQAASISKSLNAVGVLKLVQDHKLDLYTDINTYLSNWKFPYNSKSMEKKITVAHLLSHTGGLTVHGFAGYEQGKKIPTIQEILDGKIPANSIGILSMYEPGLKYEYSGGGITVSQQILMDITQEPYAKYMDENILKPMGMISSSYVQPPVNSKPELLATGYKADGKEITGKYHIYPEQAAAGLWTNPTDLSKYIIETQLAYQGKSSKVLNKSMTQTRLTPYIDKSAALGVFIVEENGTKYFQHGGANEGFRSIYWGSLEGGNGVVVMVNSDNNSILQEVVNSVAKVYDFKGLIKTVVKKHIPIDETILDTYTGEYALTPTFILTLTKENGFLITQATGQQKITIYPETQSQFFATVMNAKLEFVKDVNGKVKSVILIQNGQRREAMKIK